MPIYRVTLSKDLTTSFYVKAETDDLERYFEREIAGYGQSNIDWFEESDSDFDYVDVSEVAETTKPIFAYIKDGKVVEPF